MASLAEQYVPQCIDREEPGRAALYVWISASLLVLFWMGMIVAAPLALAHGQPGIANVIYAVFSPLCHQISERSFHLEGHAFAVCARCTGIYAGFAAGIVLYPLVRSLRNIKSPPRILLAIAVIPMAIDWSLGFAGIWENTHLSRVVTGAILGGVCAFFVVPGLVDFTRVDWRHFFSRRTASESHPREVSQSLTNDGIAPSDYGSPSSRI